MVPAPKLIPSSVVAAPPVWWSDREVINQTAPENNFALVNLGQAKWMVTQAYDELDDTISGGLGFVVTAACRVASSYAL